MATKKTIDMYGIPNCDTIKKSLDWFKKHQVHVTFHNFKTEGIDPDKLKTWVKTLGVEKLLNKKSTTWRGLTPEEQQASEKTKGALKLMATNTSIIKRPVIEWPDGSLTVGLDELAFAEKL